MGDEAFGVTRLLDPGLVPGLMEVRVSGDHCMLAAFLGSSGKVSDGNQAQDSEPTVACVVGADCPEWVSRGSIATGREKNDEYDRRKASQPLAGAGNRAAAGRY
jgi:hypothetical protein